MEDLLNQLADLSTKLGGFLAKLASSSFSIALVGALAGAYAGAVGAHWAIDKARRRTELLEEIRDVSASIVVALTICNTIISLKKQWVQPMLTRFDDDRASFDEYLAALNQESSRPAPFHCQLDLVSFGAPLLPLASLRELVYSRIGAHGKALSLAAQIEGAAAGLASAVESRNRQIGQFKDSELKEYELLFRYFGQALPSGHTYREYSDTVQAIGSYANDAIWFSYQLCLELAKLGRTKRDGFKEKFRGNPPEVNEPDFDGARQSGMIPPDTDYDSWSNWIVERNASTH